jgi:S-methyl-5-thioribose-1-phosphate isomerase
VKVNGQNYRTVWWEEASLFYIEQNLLPFTFRIAEARSYTDCCDAIRNMSIRGAGAIGAMAGFAMALASVQAPDEKYSEFLLQARKDIEATRPTARNLFYAVEKVYNHALRTRQNAISEAQRLADQDAADSRKIGEIGNTLIKDGFHIETHCNAGWLAFVDYGTALSPVYLAHEQGKNIFIYVGETRPRCQGARLTAWELNQAGIPHVIIPDNAGASLMARGKVNIMIVGADRIAVNGDVANKIGTLEKAIVAHEYGIPFYVAAPTSTIDFHCKNGAQIPIEERSGDEVLYMEGVTGAGKLERVLICSPGSSAYNPSFDVTPAKYITGIITEKGIIHPDTRSIANLNVHLRESGKFNQ